MTNDKPTGWGGETEAELAPLMRLADLLLIYVALWLPTYARGEVWDQRSWIAATTAAILFLVIGQSLSVYQSGRGAPLRPQIFRIWAGWFAGVVPAAAGQGRSSSHGPYLSRRRPAPKSTNS